MKKLKHDPSFQDFSKAPTGTILWSIELGPCVVIEIEDDDDFNRITNKDLIEWSGSNKSVWVDPLDKNHLQYKEDNWYYANGFETSWNVCQSLFWKKPEIHRPESPEFPVPVTRTTLRDELLDLINSPKKPGLYEVDSLMVRLGFDKGVSK